MINSLISRFKVIQKVFELSRSNENNSKKLKRRINNNKYFT